eukprot:jgi/Chlat1/6782/Chrsp50S06466
MNNGNTGGVVSTLPPTVQVNGPGLDNTIQLLVSDPDMDSFTRRRATVDESLTPNTTSTINTLTVSPSCALTWRTDGTVVGQLYSLQIIIEELHAGNNPANHALDFIVKIVDPPAARPPACTFDDPLPPACELDEAFGIWCNVAVGNVITFGITATASAGRDITPLYSITPSPPDAAFNITPPAGVAVASPLHTTAIFTPASPLLSLIETVVQGTGDLPARQWVRCARNRLHLLHLRPRYLLQPAGWEPCPTGVCQAELYNVCWGKQDWTPCPYGVYATPGVCRLKDDCEVCLRW